MWRSGSSNCRLHKCRRLGVGLAACVHFRGSGAPVARAFVSTTIAFLRSPANFARFIGDFRNAALHCS